MALREWGVHVQRPVSPAEVAALELAAIDVVTVPLSWRWMEASPGVLDMSAVRHLLAPFSGSALRLQGVLGPAMPHNLPDWVVRAGGVDAPEFTSWFSSYCARAAAELPELKLCRIEDELNAAHPWETLRTRRRRGRSWRRASFRRDLLLASCAAVRSARPEIELRVTLQAGTLGWQRELRGWLAAGLRVDRLGISMSPCGWLPDPRLAGRLVAALRAARSLVESAPAAAGTRPAQVELSRISYPTHRPAWTPRRQREFLVAAVAAAREGNADGFHWSSLRDQAYDDPSLGYWSPARERHEGLLYYDGSPKPVMDELRVLATGDRFGEGAAAL